MPQQRGGETPSPVLKNSSGLTSGFEYAAIWTGQSNSLPWGLPANGYEFALELQRGPTGLDLTAIIVPDDSTRAIGSVEILVVDATVAANIWNTSTWLRFGTPAAPAKGYAKVLGSQASALHVQWIWLPTNNQPAPGVAGYLVRENGKFASYENTRVLTPFMPWRDIQAPTPGIGGTVWEAPIHSAYPVPDGPIGADGQRLTLPSPYTLPTLVTTFDDLAVFLPMTKREGATGYGISEIADSAFSGTGAPTGHPITTIAGEVFTFLGAITTEVLAGAYLLVDWESAGVAKRSWAKIASSTTLDFTTDATTWLGDLKPATPPTSGALGITWNETPNTATWAADGPSEGDRIVFTGSVPAEITVGRVYRAINVVGSDCQIAESLQQAPINFSAQVTNGVGYRTWVYTAWLPHWKDNPFMWLPGPEFAYPNEDHQPRDVFVHFRARGRLTYAYNSGATTPKDGVADSRFGAMLPFAWRAGAAMGKRLNIVALGIGSTPLGTAHTVNTAAGIYPATIGWWSYEQFGFSLPLEDSDSMLSKRIKRLVTFIAPQALLAESITTSLRYLAACHIQGEADAYTEAGRELYPATVTDYKEWLRDIVDAAGLNPFEGEAKMPFVQPRITHFPWEVDDTGTIAWTDIDGYVNNSIVEVHTADEFADYALVEDLPKFNSGHFSGGGMAVLGARLAAAVLDLLDHALAYGAATALSAVNARLLRIANLALTYLGQGSRPIVTLSENTAEAKLIVMMLPEATRQLLSMRQWSWTMRHEPASQVKHSNPDWLYAYVVPGRAMSVVAIVPPATGGDANAVFVSVIAPNTRDEVATSQPEPFEIGRSPSGHRLLFTNVPETAGDIAAQVTIGSNVMFPERMPTRPTIRYVDKVIDPDRYSESFATALSWLLASMLAPALVKGQEGEVVATRCLQKCAGYVRTEATHETVNLQHKLEHNPDWLAER